MKNYLDLVEKVDEKRLYSHIYNLQGIKHPIVAREALINAYKYIISEFENIGIEVIEEDFEVESYDIPFKNIIGKLDLSNGTAGEVIISGHHDTVFNAPGANDNASAVAIVIETARIIYENQSLFSGNYRFVSFDLEEGNSIMQKDFWELGKKYGVIEKETFTKLSYKKNFEMLFSSFNLYKNEDSREKLRSEVKETKLDENERDFYNSILDYYSILLKDGEWLGIAGLLGSTHYVTQAK